MARTKTPARSEDEPDPSDYVIARLALWAGDAEEASRRLSLYTHETVRDEWSYLIDASAAHTRRQLERRQSEYRSIYSAAGIEHLPSSEHILRSAGNHLGGVIWVENEREYELRAYLIELDWEREFYRNARIQAKRHGRLATELELGLPYGYKRVHWHDPASLGIEWAIEGTMLLQIAVGDFWSATAHGTWVKAPLPSSLSAIVSPFQSLLDALDPGTANGTVG